MTVPFIFVFSRVSRFHIRGHGSRIYVLKKKKDNDDDEERNNKMAISLVINPMLETETLQVINGTLSPYREIVESKLAISY